MEQGEDAEQPSHEANTTPKTPRTLSMPSLFEKFMAALAAETQQVFIKFNTTTKG